MFKWLGRKRQIETWVILLVIAVSAWMVKIAASGVSEVNDSEELAKKFEVCGYYEKVVRELNRQYPQLQIPMHEE